LLRCSRHLFFFCLKVGYNNFMISAVWFL
jgi:hypothetical protein